jgi:hypothetical protein
MRRSCGIGPILQVTEKTTAVILKANGFCCDEEAAFVFNSGSYRQIRSSRRAGSGQALRFAQDDRTNAFLSNLLRCAYWPGRFSRNTSPDRGLTHVFGCSERAIAPRIFSIKSSPTLT